MKEPPDPRVYLEDILEAAGKAREFTTGLSFEQFEADEKSIYAVVRALEIVGEASKRVPQPIRDRATEVPWRSMSGMRDKLIHAYSGVDLKVVWGTVHEELPSVVTAIETLLQDLSEP